MLAFIIYLITRFVIFFAIFSLRIKYNEIALRYIYNSLNVKDRIAILIRKQKLIFFYQNNLEKSIYISLKLYINQIYI